MHWISPRVLKEQAQRGGQCTALAREMAARVSVRGRQPEADIDSDDDSVAGKPLKLHICSFVVRLDGSHRFRLYASSLASLLTFVSPVSLLDVDRQIK